MKTRRKFLTALGTGALAAARLRDLGYVEGRNLIIEARWGEDSSARVEKLAAELVGEPKALAADVRAFFRDLRWRRWDRSDSVSTW